MQATKDSAAPASTAIQKKTATNAVARAGMMDPHTKMKALITQMKDGIKAALPAVITPERFSRIVLSALSRNPQLAQTTQQSFLGAMMTAAQLGMEPNTPLGQAYLIPFKNHGMLECQFQLGYKGMIDLAYRSGDVVMIQANDVRERDTFEYELGLDPKLRHIPARGDRGAATYYYAMFKTKLGGVGFAVMSVEDIKAHAQKFSQSFGRGALSPWTSNFDEMAKKTVLKKCLKYAPLKSEFVRALSNDETVKSRIDVDMSDVENEAIDAETVEAPADTTAPAPEAADAKDKAIEDLI